MAENISFNKQVYKQYKIVLIYIKYNAKYIITFSVLMEYNITFIFIYIADY